MRFYREKQGEKLLISDELVQVLRQEELARQQAEKKAELESEYFTC
jgi:hypothetical protein